MVCGGFSLLLLFVEIVAVRCNFWFRGLGFWFLIGVQVGWLCFRILLFWCCGCDSSAGGFGVILRVGGLGDGIWVLLRL